MNRRRDQGVERQVGEDGLASVVWEFFAGGRGTVFCKKESPGRPSKNLPFGAGTHPYRLLVTSPCLQNCPPLT